MPTPESLQHRAHTKIIATLGPACWDAAVLAELVAAGADVFRLNSAHADAEAVAAHVKKIRALSEELGQPIGILLDLAGPKIRLGELAVELFECREGAHVRLVRGEKTDDPKVLVCNYAPLIDELDVGDRVMLNDGTVGATVIKKQADAVTLSIFSAGSVRSRQGINLPGAKLSIQSPTDDDLRFARLAAELEIDFVGLSFVRTPDEIRRLRSELDTAGSRAMIIAKIEKPEALERLKEIVEEADGIMVARGDLGVEIDVAEMAVVQKRILALCTDYRKPAIVATQMLESMRTNRQPTRAEATDVANAILDGADACMLSGETAIGEHPREAVAMMNRIALATEPILRDSLPAIQMSRPGDAVREVTLAIVHGAAEIADQLDAKLVVVVTHSGATAVARAKQRDFIPTVAVSREQQTLRQLCLLWGVTPRLDVPADDPRALAEHIDEWGQREGLLARGDYVIHITGTGLAGIPHDQVIVHEVK